MINKNGFFVTSRMTYFGENTQKERNTLIAWLTSDKIAYTTYCRLYHAKVQTIVGLLLVY